MHARLAARTRADRLDDGLAWCEQMQGLRRAYIGSRHPGASESEVLALWTEETFRGRVDDGLLARACAEIRRRGEAGALPEA